MRQPLHAMATRREMTPDRIAGLGFVAVLHVIVIWAIVAGLVQKFVKLASPPPIVVVDVTKKPLEPTTQPKLPVVDVPAVTPTMEPPVVNIDRDGGPTAPPGPPKTVAPLTPPTPDSLAAGVAGTHTTPPYPALARRLEKQGSVKLSLAISAEGIVTAANVVQSSGFDDLDEAAVGWVIQHWRYKPATQAGQPVASTSMAVVVFNLKNAR